MGYPIFWCKVESWLQSWLLFRVWDKLDSTAGTTLWLFLTSFIFFLSFFFSFFFPFFSFSISIFQTVFFFVRVPNIHFVLLFHVSTGCIVFWGCISDSNEKGACVMLYIAAIYKRSMVKSRGVSRSGVICLVTANSLKLDSTLS